MAGSQIQKLQMADKSEFVDSFVNLVPRVDVKTLGEMVWQFANQEWRNGYNQAKVDVSFDDE